MKKYKDIDEYISNYPVDVQKTLQKLRKTIQESAPQATEAISYGIPTFRLKGNLVHFAAYDKHIGFYPASSGVEAFKDRLTGYETSKGTIRFPINEDLPWNIIKQIVKFRVSENINRSK